MRKIQIRYCTLPAAVNRILNKTPPPLKGKRRNESDRGGGGGVLIELLRYLMVKFVSTHTLLTEHDGLVLLALLLIFPLRLRHRQFIDLETSSIMSQMRGLRTNNTRKFTGNTTRAFSQSDRQKKTKKPEHKILEMHEKGRSPLTLMDT